MAVTLAAEILQDDLAISLARAMATANKKGKRKKEKGKRERQPDFILSYAPRKPVNLVLMWREAWFPSHSMSSMAVGSK